MVLIEHAQFDSAPHCLYVLRCLPYTGSGEREFQDEVTAHEKPESLIRPLASVNAV